MVGEVVFELAEAHDSGSKNIAVRQHHSRILNLEFIAMSSPIRVFGVMNDRVEQGSIGFLFLATCTQLFFLRSNLYGQ